MMMRMYAKTKEYRGCPCTGLNLNHHVCTTMMSKLLKSIPAPTCFGALNIYIHLYIHALRLSCHYIPDTKLLHFIITAHKAFIFLTILTSNSYNAFIASCHSTTLFLFHQQASFHVMNNNNEQNVSQCFRVPMVEGLGPCIVAGQTCIPHSRTDPS